VTARANNGAKAAPPSLRLLKGYVDTSGQARNPDGTPIPTPPPYVRLPPVKPETLSPDAARMWDLVVPELTRVELLKPLDGPSLEMACETYSRWCEAVRWRRERGVLASNSQGVVVAPWARVEQEASREFRGWCAEYGLTPAAENKVGKVGPASDDDNPFDT